MLVGPAQTWMVVHPIVIKDSLCQLHIVPILIAFAPVGFLLTAAKGGCAGAHGPEIGTTTSTQAGCVQ
ncbi:hypothetical protein VTK73DRAFT_8881 [Phialemonium thermophilum]|uniref:Uncharacterized protein n=1 Tax=Phialemonium thermophilum TaxID=223376 RepID=A0ABR3W5N8_9PEZI